MATSTAGSIVSTEANEKAGNNNGKPIRINHCSSVKIKQQTRPKWCAQQTQ